MAAAVSPLQTKGQASFDIEIATLARRTGELENRLLRGKLLPEAAP